METQDLIGTTAHYNGIVGTTQINIPTTAGNVISEVLLKCPAQSGQKQCFISFDGGTNFFTLEEGEFIGWAYKGEQKQVQIKGSAASTEYQIIVNFEDY